MYKAITSPLSRATLKALGIDFEKHLKDLDPISLQAGYVGYCNQNSLTLHYVAGRKLGLRSTFTRASSDKVVAAGMVTQDGSKIETHSATCRLISQDLPRERPNSTNQRVLRQAQDPSTINFLLVGRSSATDLDTPIHIKFSKPGFFSKGAGFRLDEGFEGPTAHTARLGKRVEFDVPANWDFVYLDWITGQVKSKTSNGEIITIGETFEDSGTWVIKFSVDASEERSRFKGTKSLILEPKSTNPLGRRTL